MSIDSEPLRGAHEKTGKPLPAWLHWKCHIDVLDRLRNTQAGDRELNISCNGNRGKGIIATMFPIRIAVLSGLCGAVLIGSQSVVFPAHGSTPDDWLDLAGRYLDLEPGPADVLRENDVVESIEQALTALDAPEPSR